MGSRPGLQPPHEGSALRGLARRDGPWYVGGVVVGACLIVVAAVRQPFSYDELTQIAPYASDSVSEVVSATRQPPLDPLLGALLQHLFGTGQLQQRGVPVLAGLATLMLTSLLLRRWGLGLAGAFAVWVLATAPLMVRYSAYTRPYALPMAFMLLYAYAAQRWLDGDRRRWLVVATGAAVLLPLVRVPEPTAFLAAAATGLPAFSLRGRLPWRRSGPLAATTLVALLAVGVPMIRLLQTKGSHLFSLNPVGAVHRLGRGAHELAAGFVPLIASSFPWWPVTALVVVVALAVPASRRRVVGTPLWWSLLAAPVAFALAYHLLPTFPLDTLPYRPRAAYFFLPAYIVVVAAVASSVQRGGVRAPWARGALVGLLAAALLTQLPATARVLVQDAAPDFDKISAVLTGDLPRDAIVLYDRPSPVGQSRQPFQGTPRYMGDIPTVRTVRDLVTHPRSAPARGPVYLLVNGQCAKPGRCLASRHAWDGPVPGWRLVLRQERFALFEPERGQDGRAGAVAALSALGTALGPELGYVDTFAAAALLQQDGDEPAAQALVGEMYDAASPDVAERIRTTYRYTLPLGGS